MRILVLSIISFLTLLYSDEYKTALQPCELYNTIKHTKNSGTQRLKEGERYRILREQAGQYYVHIPGINVPSRWVDQNCFEESVTLDNQDVKEPVLPVSQDVIYTESLDQAVSGKPKELLLALSWHHAFCETHRRVKECMDTRRYENIGFVLHGLWPQPKDNIYCGVSREQKQLDKIHQWNRLMTPSLKNETLSALQDIMPATASGLHRHEWIKHGRCYGTDAQSYFDDAVSLTSQVERSALGSFFAQNIGKQVSLRQIRFKADEAFGKGSGKKVEMRCHQGMVTEVWFHLGYGGSDLSQLLKEGREVRSGCTQGKIDMAGFR
jgi:ribonuclease T2